MFKFVPFIPALSEYILLSHMSCILCRFQDYRFTLFVINNRIKFHIYILLLF
ncbi:hypothetical protein HMPREF9413_4481 [Paenibacillus sp. HGF7]|nr:hypothetical protein HMPREF9413_4481 [Paenibacillus sp. HGF7]